MPTRRQKRVAQRIVEEVSAEIRTLKDPRIGFVTVTGATVSPDLHEAKVWVSVLGDAETQKATFEALTHSARHIQTRIGPRLHIRVTPQLRFVYDDLVEHADGIARLISEARASDPNPASPEESGGEFGEDDTHEGDAGEDESGGMD